MQINPDELLAVILVHRGLPSFVQSEHPASAGNVTRRRPRPFLALKLVSGAAEADDLGIELNRGTIVGEVSYKGHRSPAEIIAHCVWLFTGSR